MAVRDFLLEERAKYFATGAHAAVAQMRKYSEEPYIVHPIRVANYVAAAGGTSHMIAAAYLHDVVEDTRTTVTDIERNFGGTVASLVQELTDCAKEEGNRAFRKEVDRERLSLASPEAQTIKLADLIDNTSTIIRHDPKFATQYLKEKRALLEVMTKGDPVLFAMAKEQCS